MDWSSSKDLVKVFVSANGDCVEKPSSTISFGSDNTNNNNNNATPNENAALIQELYALRNSMFTVDTCSAINGRYWHFECAISTITATPYTDGACTNKSPDWQQKQILLTHRGAHVPATNC